jgi:hypothetical protein
VVTWETHVFRLRLGDRKRSYLRGIVAPHANSGRWIWDFALDGGAVLDLRFCD